MEDTTLIFGAEDDWVEMPDDPVAFFEEIEKSGWGDGLPVLPPTLPRIEQFLEFLPDQDPDEPVGVMPPAMRQVTPAKVAANAVMAGCIPEAMPVLLATVDALLDPDLNLTGLQATTHPVAPMIIVHGPAVAELGIHSGAGLFGSGWRGNLTLGRAVRLLLLNLGGARPGDLDRATHGQPSKISFCIAEESGVSPWSPYATESRGLPPETSGVTVFGGENPHNVNDHVSTSASGVLTTVASTMAVMGANHAYLSQGEVFVVVGPEHARTIADDGFSRSDVQWFLFERARLPSSELRKGGNWGGQVWAAWVEALIATGDDVQVPFVRDSKDIQVLVAGGPGKHSLVIPGFGISRSVTRSVGKLHRVKG